MIDSYVITFPAFYARNYEDGAEFSFSLPMDEKELTEEKEL